MRDSSELSKLREPAAARVAAESGDEPHALELLECSLAYWSNPPLMHLDVWECDSVWDPVRDRPELRKVLEAKRRPVGQVYGELFRFPGWYGAP